MLDSKKFAEINRPVNFYPVLLIAGDWILLSFGVYLLTFSSVVINTLGFLLLLRQQLSLSVLMHEGVHYSLAKNKKLNDILGAFFCSGPILSHFSTYRTLHMKHHRHALSSEDPGQYLLGSQKSLKTLGVDILKDLSGLTVISLGKKVQVEKISMKTILFNFSGQVFGLFLVWSIFKSLGLSGIQFFFLWILPIMTLHQVVLRIRALMEHGGFNYHKDVTQCTRTVAPGFLTAILAPHNINYHIEHHLYPTVPSSRLEMISRELGLNQDDHYIEAGRNIILARMNR